MITAFFVREDLVCAVAATDLLHDFTLDDLYSPLPGVVVGWRRGHVRNQPHGAGRARWKLITIEPKGATHSDEGQFLSRPTPRRTAAGDASVGSWARLRSRLARSFTPDLL